MGSLSEGANVEFAEGFVPKMNLLMEPVSVGVVGSGIGLASMMGLWASPSPSLWAALALAIALLVLGSARSTRSPPGCSTRLPPMRPTTSDSPPSTKVRHAEPGRTPAHGRHRRDDVRPSLGILSPSRYPRTRDRPSLFPSRSTVYRWRVTRRYQELACDTVAGRHRFAHHTHSHWDTGCQALACDKIPHLRTRTNYHISFPNTLLIVHAWLLSALHRRNVLKVAGTASALPFVTGLGAAASQDDDGDDDDGSGQRKRPGARTCVRPTCIHPTLGYSGLSRRGPSVGAATRSRGQSRHPPG